MAVVLKSYFDGSGKSDDKECRYLTLAGYAATPAKWEKFEQVWHAFLERWKIKYLHMTDALALQGEFTKEKGWDDRKVYVCVRDMIATCLHPVAGFEKDFIGFSATLDMEAWRSQEQILGDRLRDPESICVNHAVGPVLSMLPEDASDPTGRTGDLEIYFDRGEKFLNRIDRVWRSLPRPKRRGWLRLITKIEALEMERIYPLQLADFSAYTCHQRYCYGQDTYGLMKYFSAKHYHNDVGENEIADAAWSDGKEKWR